METDFEGTTVLALGALTTATADCAGCPGAPCRESSFTTVTLESAATIAVQMHWVLRTPAHRCFGASYTAEPPSLVIGATSD